MPGQIIYQGKAPVQLLAGFKEPEPLAKGATPKTSIQNAIKYSNKQGAELPVIILDKNHQDKQQIFNALNGSLNNKDWNKNISEIILVYTRKKPMVIKLNRAEIENKSFKKKLP